MTVIDTTKTLQNVLENPLTDSTPAWDETIEYNTDDVVQDDGYIYKFVGSDPESGLKPEDNLTKWVYWDNIRDTVYPIKFPSNKYRLFDPYSSTKSTNDSDFEIVFNNELFDYIGGYSIYCEKIEITMMDKDDESITYPIEGESPYIIDMKANELFDWYDWTWYPEASIKTNFNLYLPIHVNTKIKVKFVGTNIEVGLLEIGNSIAIGCTIDNISLNFKSSKQIQRDIETGNMFIGDRKTGGYRELSVSVSIMDYKKVDEVLDTLWSLLQIPTTFIADDRDNIEIRKANYTLRGIIEEVSNTLTNSLSNYNLTIKGI